MPPQTTKTRQQWTVAIRPKGREKPRNITTIEGLGGNGFSVSLPFHNAHAGYLFKQPVAPGMGMPHSVAWARATEFGPRDKVKLSYHVDGFAEFCADRSDRIAATRDLISGEVKGLGLFSAPLAQPSVGGPAIAITVYGIDQFVIPKEIEGSGGIGSAWSSSVSSRRGCASRRRTSWCWRRGGRFAARRR